MKVTTQLFLGALVVISFVVVKIVVEDYKNIGKLNDQVSKLNGQIVKLKEHSKAEEIKDHRIDCMVKALITVYGLSRWEAHYYSIIFDDFSKEYNTPWEIYPAVIRVESNFRCTLVSSKSAKGIMQILEPTAELLANDLGMTYVKGETLWNDFTNMILGCYYLSSNIKEKGLDGGVQAYLGGPAFLISAKTNRSVSKYLGEYKTTVGREFKNLSYIYRGIVTESGYNYSELHSSKYQDSIEVNTELFSKGQR